MNRYEAEAQEVESQIAFLKERLARFEARGATENRIQSVRDQIKELEAKPLASWRATGKWAQEIWG